MKTFIKNLNGSLSEVRVLETEEEYAWVQEGTLYFWVAKNDLIKVEEVKEKQTNKKEVSKMSKKQWYVAVEMYVNGIKKQVIQYTGTKKEAESILKTIKLNNIDYSYIEFIWKKDVLNKVPFSRLHGKNWIKVKSIIELLPTQEIAI